MCCPTMQDGRPVWLAAIRICLRAGGRSNGKPKQVPGKCHPGGMAADEIDWDSVRASVVAPAKSIWPHEVRDFAPWLIQSLDLLGEKLGMHLRAAGREITVGTFRADIVATDDAGRKVIIEVQFGPSDHQHLGQVVVYACEAQADVVVWVVGDQLNMRTAAFRPEHRRALTRLNEVFAGQIEFFGVVVTNATEPRSIHETDKPAGPFLPEFTVTARPGG
jgi:hypothetical protein